MKVNYKKLGIITGAVIAGLYVLFLILPFIISPFMNAYSGKVADIIKEQTGYEARIDKIGITTAPDLSAGLKAKEISIFIPGEQKALFKTENFNIRLSLIPLLARKIQLDSISMDSIGANIEVKQDGNFLFFDFLKQHEKKEGEPEEMLSLPWGFKLSNTLPDIKIKEYDFVFVDVLTDKSYYIEGENLLIHDFVLDKHVKVSAKGKVVLDGKEVSDFNIKISNNIMPNLQLNDLVFQKSAADMEGEKVSTAASFKMPFNVIDIFKSVNKNQLRANLFMDVKTSGTFKNPRQRGHFRIDGLTAASGGIQLPESYADLKFKGSKTDVDSIFYTSVDENEKTQIIGTIKSGRNAGIDLTLRSNAKINNIIRLVDSIAQSFEIEDFKTISATGSIDADFNLNSNFKKVSSQGYLKINPSSIKYGLYNISVDNITADVNFDNNNINIKKAGFSLLGHPLKLTGIIKPDAQTDLTLTGSNLSVKGLLAAAGQKTILKENTFNGGLLSVNALVKGKLNDLKPDISLKIAGVDILNKVSDLRILLNNAIVKLTYNSKVIAGDVDINSMTVRNPAASISIPKAKVRIDKDNINIINSYMLVNNSRVDVQGSVKDYLNDKLNMNITAKGNLNSSDIMAFIPQNMHSMFPYAGRMPLNITVTGDTKAQNISADLKANPSNYIKFIDISYLKGKTTNIHSDMKYSNDVLSFSNTSVKASGTPVITMNGDIRRLTSNPKLNLNINVPNKISFPVWGMETSNITASGSADITGSLDNPYIKGSFDIPDMSVKNLDFALKNLVLHLDGAPFSGTASADKFSYGNIIATNITSDFALKNYSDFYLTNLNADAFSGKVNGKISYSLPTTSIGLNMSGKGLNSTNAVYGATGIKNALTGTMGFDANLAMHGVMDREIINSMKGNVSFNIDDGRFMSIGRFENLVKAQNIETVSILKSAVSSLSTLTVIQQTDSFKNITGTVTISNGNANISKINVSGPLMSYYVKGTYYMLPNSASLIILGRLDSKVVSVLGVLGQLSAERLLSYIPKIGVQTAQFLNKLTEDPKNENTALIPALSSGSTVYKDFKVIFNGPVESSTSVRSFKWLSKCDTSKIDIKKDFKDAQNSVKTNINNQIKIEKQNAQNVKNNVTNIVNNQKQKVQETKQAVEQTKQNVQNIKNNASNFGKLFMNAVQNANKTYTPAESDK